MFPARRRRLFVDLRLQGALLAHVALYWFYCLLSVALVASCWTILVKRPDTSAELFRFLWHDQAPALIGSVLLLPLVLMDCLRMSNRFAGPMVRMRGAMKALADGEQVAPVKLRDGDFWMDFAADFNRVLDRGVATAAATESASEPQPRVASCLVDSSVSTAAGDFSQLSV